VRVNEALVDLLEFSKRNSMLALVTSASRDSTLSLLMHLKLLECFDLTITSDDCKFRKPNPEPYILAASNFNVFPEECLVFEDSDIGIQSAQAFGAKVLRVCW
jgi:HAD superfamily hydrolase (TIGR01509 family)